MSCNCQPATVTSPTGECLPTIADECALAKDATLCTPCPSDDSCLNSDQSDGTTLASTWLDAGCYSEGVYILGRVGSKLARFAGTGFIKLVNGSASVVSSVPLKASTIWHRWWKPTATSSPILGEPLAYPYLTIASTTGDLHAIKGPVSEDAIPYWDAGTAEFTQKPVSEIELDRKGVIPRADDIELVGYTPIAEGGEATAVRRMKALSGAGLVVLTEQATIDDSCDCAPGSGTASVATTLALPVPVADETYTLKYSTALGLYWSEDAP